MTTGDLFQWDDRHAVVVGGATGMGKECGDLVSALGGSVTVLDVQEPSGDHDHYVEVDLRSPESIDAALDAIEGPVHAVFSAAGISTDGLDLAKINWIGHRHFLDGLLARDAMPAGSAIAMIASIGGMAWEKNLDHIGDFLDNPDYGSALAWMESHPERAEYGFCKQVMIAYCGRMAPDLQKRGIRINAAAPGPTETPLMAATPAWQGFSAAFPELMHRDASTAEEQAYPLVFLASRAASFINGTCLIVDGGFVGAGIAGSISGPAVESILAGPQPGYTEPPN